MDSPGRGHYAPFQLSRFPVNPGQLRPWCGAVPLPDSRGMIVTLPPGVKGACGIPSGRPLTPDSSATYLAAISPIGGMWRGRTCKTRPAAGGLGDGGRAGVMRGSVAGPLTDRAQESQLPTPVGSFTLAPGRLQLGAQPDYQAAQRPRVRHRAAVPEPEHCHHAPARLDTSSGTTTGRTARGSRRRCELAYAAAPACTSLTHGPRIRVNGSWPVLSVTVATPV